VAICAGNVAGTGAFGWLPAVNQSSFDSVGYNLSVTLKTIPVIPAQAGIHFDFRDVMIKSKEKRDPGLRRDDGMKIVHE
jgi:hypothetical protein